MSTLLFIVTVIALIVAAIFGPRPLRLFIITGAAAIIVVTGSVLLLAST